MRVEWADRGTRVMERSGSNSQAGNQATDGISRIIQWMLLRERQSVVLSAFDRPNGKHLKRQAVVKITAQHELRFKRNPAEAGLVEKGLVVAS